MPLEFDGVLGILRQQQPFRAHPGCPLREPQQGRRGMQPRSAREAVRALTPQAAQADALLQPGADDAYFESHFRRAQ
ncbi:MAG: hypothetical protein NVS3B2_16180 [Ramlibacter sp.]